MVTLKTACAELLMVSLLGVAGCGGDDDDAETSAEESSKPIVIKTNVAPLNARGETTGEVRSGSTIGDSAFCAGGKFADAPQEPGSDGPVVRTFRCSGDTLTISFSATGAGLKQSGDWKVVKGLGSCEGLGGGGQMEAVFESRDGAGRDTFTGTVTR